MHTRCLTGIVLKKIRILLKYNVISLLSLWILYGCTPLSVLYESRRMTLPQPSSVPTFLEKFQLEVFS